MPATDQKILDPPSVAYLANLFPTAVEPYVGEEIIELQRRGVRIVPCSVWQVSSQVTQCNPKSGVVVTVFTWRPWLLFGALSLSISRRAALKDLLTRLLWMGSESWGKRARGLIHTLFGARLALQLKNQNIQHIHVHHGYMAAWIGMVAARLLNISYSVTLHGSDLLLRPAFLDTKLAGCTTCFTVSEYNQQHLFRMYPQIDPVRVLLQRMGVFIPQFHIPRKLNQSVGRSFTLLAIGRLHTVKDHSFLIRCCAVLKASGEEVRCWIAGEGPERKHLENLIRKLGLRDEVQLLGHTSRSRLNALFCEANLVVLTSQSEGIPLVLMEAMASGCPVLAPSITGIPELILDGKTGFLYRPGSITDFVDRVRLIQKTYSALGPICEAARQHVDTFFNLETNLQQFGDAFIRQVLGSREGVHADSLLQQVQL